MCAELGIGFIVAEFFRIGGTGGVIFGSSTIEIPAHQDVVTRSEIVARGKSAYSSANEKGDDVSAPTPCKMKAAFVDNPGTIGPGDMIIYEDEYLHKVST